MKNHLWDSHNPCSSAAFVMEKIDDCRLIKRATEEPCFHCPQPAEYVLGTTPVCILHFSVIRNEMRGLVLKEHAYVHRNR